MQRVLVTGGTGYIGSHTMIDLIENGYEPVSIDNGLNSNASILHNVTKITGKTIKNYAIDLCDLDEVKKVFAENNFVGIIHFAALKSVGDSVKYPIQYFKNNNNSLLNVIECAQQYDVKHLIFSSSCTVYGDVRTSPVTEETPMQEAASPYGRTKQIGEQMIHDIYQNTDHKAILLRYFNPAGAHESGWLGEAPSQVAQNLIPVITETAIGKRPSMKVFGSDYPTRDGSCVRDFIHVMDLAHAHTLALQYLLSGKQDKNVDVFNLGIGQGVTVLEAIKAFEEISGVSLNYKLAPRREGDVMAIYSNYEKASKLLNWQPKFGIEDIMRTAWEWEKRRV